MSRSAAAGFVTAAIVLLSLGACSSAAGEEDVGKASPIALVVLIAFFIAVGFLVRSMTKHLKRVPESFEEPSEPAADAGEPEAGEPAEEPGAGETAQARTDRRDEEPPAGS